MTSHKETYDEEISPAELIRKGRTIAREIWSERRLLTKTLVISIVLGLIIAFGSGEEYEATTRLIPYRSGAGSASSLSGLAGLAGIRLPAGSADQTITADLYPEVARSQDFRLKIAETPLSFSSLEKKMTAVEYFRDIRQLSLTELAWRYTAGLPGLLLAKLIPTQQNRRVLVSDSTTAETIASYDADYTRLLRQMSERLTVVSDKKTSVITIKGMMPDPHAAADLVRISSDQLMKRIIAFETQKAQEQFRFVAEQHQKAKSRYDLAQRHLAEFSDRNRALMSFMAQIERDRLQREFDLSFEVYQQVSRELEQARIKMNQDTPVFAVLDRPSVPNTRKSPKRTLVLLVSMALGLTIGVSRIGIRHLLNETT